jgi:hypothetical protein
LETGGLAVTTSGSGWAVFAVVAGDPSVADADAPRGPSRLDEPALGDLLAIVFDDGPFDVGPLEGGPDDDDELAPPEPVEPVVSARATPGTDAITAPTPKATASTPRRPTYRTSASRPER